MADPATPSFMLTLTAQIVAAHVSATKIAPDEIPALINTVYGALARAGAPTPEMAAQEPAVPIKRSIQNDYLVCLEDGVKVKMLKRYLARFGLTPETYRAKWGLSGDYPMVAPGYSAHRAVLAKRFGLGSAARDVEQAPPMQPDIQAAPTVPVEPEAQHTAASVFANFPGFEVPEEASSAASDTAKPERKRFAQQFMRVERKRSGG